MPRSRRRSSRSGDARPGEFELIARYLAPLAKGYPLAFGLKDDIGLIETKGAARLVAKTDALVAGRHFLPSDPADLVARKLLRVNLSDLAAKGATPLVYLLDLCLPDDFTAAWIGAFAQGLGEDQKRYGLHLIGGDTVATPGPATLAVTLIGQVPKRQPIRA
ncbi:MAG: thiamine-monophosphate kinase, partial [Alphaproteobacteria bacterium]|nr:thiamine-monophosphate kinase [Alphaproteobacteria bacterium]